MKILLTTIVMLGIIAQFMLDHVVLQERRRKFMAIGIAVLTVVALWGNYFIQESSSDRLTQALDTLKSSNVGLQEQLKLRNDDLAKLRHQADSQSTMLAEVGNKQSELNIIGKSTLNEVQRSRQVVESLRSPTSARIIPIAERERLKTALKKSPGSIQITSMMGDNETYQFADQLKGLLAEAGWTVDGVSQAIFDKQPTGLILQVRQEPYPTRVNEVYQVLRFIGFDVVGEINTDLGTDDIKLIIGHQ